MLCDMTVEYETQGNSTRRAICRCMQGYEPRLTGSVIRRPSDCVPTSKQLMLFHRIVSRVANCQLSPTRGSLFPRIGCSLAYGVALRDEGWGFSQSHKENGAD